MEQFAKRQLVVVAENEVVFQVECRNRVFLAEIEGIDLLLNAGSPVHRLAVGVARQEGETSRCSLEGRLQAAVIGVAHVLVNVIRTGGIRVWEPRPVDNRPVGSRVYIVLTERTTRRRPWPHILRLAQAKAQTW